MQSPLPSPPLTRFDVVMWFLRVQMWLRVVAVVASSFSSTIYLFTPFYSPWLWLRVVVSSGVPVLILLLFPAVLASSVLGQTMRDPVTSLADLKPLVGRCIGLILFVSSLVEVVFFSGLLIYALATRAPSLGLGPGMTRSMAISQIVGPTISFFLGFALAFGPNIRDSLRAR